MSRIVLYDIANPFGGDEMARELTEIMFPDHAVAEVKPVTDEDTNEIATRHRLAAE